MGRHLAEEEKYQCADPFSLLLSFHKRASEGKEEGERNMSLYFYNFSKVFHNDKTQGKKGEEGGKGKREEGPYYHLFIPSFSLKKRLGKGRRGERNKKKKDVSSLNPALSIPCSTWRRPGRRKKKRGGIDLNSHFKYLERGEKKGTSHFLTPQMCAA